MSNEMSAKLLEAFGIMGFGMAGIFVVSIILYLVSLGLLKAFPNAKK